MISSRALLDLVVVSGMNISEPERTMVVRGPGGVPSHRLLQRGTPSGCGRHLHPRGTFSAPAAAAAG